MIPKLVEELIMKRIGVIAIILMLLSAKMLAQTEGNNSVLLGGSTSSLYAPNDLLLSDTLKLHLNPPQFTTPLQMKAPSYGQHNDFIESSKMGAVGFQLWKNASIGVVGSTYHLPGLMDISSGSLTLRQDLGRWHFTASGMANKYLMPWQHSLSTQYGFGGTVGFDLSKNVTLYAFASYYANRMMVGPAMSPYVNTTTFGGYADVRFSSIFGANVGVRRYLNPMIGKWTTEPIINPYIKLGDSKIELPLGGLLQKLVWGDRDNPMNFRPHPMSRPPVKR